MFQAIAARANVVVQLASGDMVEFQKALNKDGMDRVERALAGLDARNASASVASDKGMIIGDIEATVGLEEFNSLVRSSMRREYKRIATSAGMAPASYMASWFLRLPFAISWMAEAASVQSCTYTDHIHRCTREGA